ncbi:MAG: dipeptidase [Candidatus Delongbacteria bacterium]|nr:dipeptidase [Candidatus Delongbacteria bacterium]
MAKRNIGWWGIILVGLLSRTDSQDLVIKPEAAKLHRQAVVFDAHADTPLRLKEKQFDISLRNDFGHIDIPRLIEGGVDVQVFAIYFNPKLAEEKAVRLTLDYIDLISRTIEANRNHLELALSAPDVTTINQRHKTAIVMGLEGGYAIAGDLGILRQYYKLGVRYMTLTWMNSHEWADASTDTVRWGGLNDFGREVIREMNRLGMLIDLSHASDETFWDVLEITQKPIIASHSCCRTLCPHERNLSDDMLIALARNGGVIGINYYPGYLDSSYLKISQENSRLLKPMLDELNTKYPNHDDLYYQEREKLYEPYKGRLPVVAIDRVIDHIDHVVKVAGIDHVGLGSDFDGISITPLGLKDVSCLPIITQKLMERGYKDHEIKKIMGGNFMRVFSQL